MQAALRNCTVLRERDGLKLSRFGRWPRWIRLGGLSLALVAWGLSVGSVQAAESHTHEATPTPHAGVEVGSSVVELSLPDLITLPPFDLRVVDIPSTGKRILRFSNSIANIGPGPLELVGRPGRGTDAYQVTQRLYGSHQDILAEPVIPHIRFHHDHDHYHLDEFSRYELWSLSDSGQLEELVAVSSKVSYCVMDTEPLAATESARPGYASCFPSLQGLSPGWSDTYASHLAGQWLEITDLPPGMYLLRSIADPADHLREADDFNNEGHLLFELNGTELRVIDPSQISWLRKSPASPHETTTPASSGSR